MAFRRLSAAALSALTAAGLVAACPATRAGAARVNASPLARAAAAPATTAWRAGAFRLSTADVVRQANIVLARPNPNPAQSMALGNGTLGAAVWAANGFTAQLNRVDTLPGRKSPGWVTIPGLAALTGAADFSAYVDPYDGVLRESGGGLSAAIYVQADKSELVVDVTGADPAVPQTAAVNLWAGRSPQVAASGALGTLAETWQDDTPLTGSGRTFGSLAALTAGGRDVTASVLDATGVQVAFRPHADGSFRVVVGAPTWTGGDATRTATKLLHHDADKTSAALQRQHLKWWHEYWDKVGLLKLSSADGAAQYMQKLRTLYYFYAAAERGGQIPGSQAGVADLFNFSRDYLQWYPAAFWFWNLRMQVAANLAGPADVLNAPVYRLYTRNLANIEAWTKAKMGGLPGICVPETMRFNGNGYQSDTDPYAASSCDQTVPPTWNGSTITTGAEIGLWVWQQYQYTGDRKFLAENYPLLRESARFLLAYAKTGPDGLLHTVSNVHENQWYVQDPTNTIAAMAALFPATAAAAQLLHTDADLVTDLTAAQAKLPGYARTDAATHRQLRTAADDGAPDTVLGQSYQPTAALHNNENDDLEPVWPYNQIGDDSALTPLAIRTYQHRVTGTLSNDWSFDAVHAARLGLGSEVGTNLIALTNNYQSYPSGLGAWHGGVGANPYIEQSANVALALNEAVVQDYDGLVRIGPAVPPGWDVDGTLPIQGRSSVSVQIHGGVVGTVAIQAGSTGTVTVRNPWRGQPVDVVAGHRLGKVVVAATTADRITIPVVRGHSYVVQQTAAPVSNMTFQPVTDTAATAPSQLGTARIGIAVPHPGDPGAIVGYGGLCLDDAGAQAVEGNQIVLWWCSGAANQTWTVVAATGEIRTLGGCLTVGSGDAVVWGACTGSAAQAWTPQADGTLLNRGTGRCLDDPAAGGAGTALAVWTCSGSANQVWTLPGQ